MVHACFAPLTFAFFPSFSLHLFFALITTSLFPSHLYRSTCRYYSSYPCSPYAGSSLGTRFRIWPRVRREAGAGKSVEGRSEKVLTEFDTWCLAPKFLVSPQCWLDVRFCSFRKLERTLYHRSPVPGHHIPNPRSYIHFLLPRPMR